MCLTYMLSYMKEASPSCGLLPHQVDQVGLLVRFRSMQATATLETLLHRHAVNMGDLFGLAWHHHKSSMCCNISVACHQHCQRCLADCDPEAASGCKLFAHK